MFLPGWKRLLPALLVLPIAACGGGNSVTPSAQTAQSVARAAAAPQSVARVGTAASANRAHPLLQPVDSVYIAGTTSSGTGAIVEFNINLSNTPNYGTTITSGINDPSLILQDDQFDLFVLNAHGNATSATAPSITEYNAGGTLTTTISKGLVGTVPTAMTIGYESTPYLFVNDNTTKVHEVIGYAAPYTAAPFVKLTPPGDSDIYQVALDNSDDLVVVTASGVYEYAAPYTAAPTTIYATSSDPTNVPHSCTIDGYGNLWIGLTSSILGYTGGFPNPATPSTTIAFTTKTSGVKEVKFDSSGNLVALEQMNAAGETNVVVIPSPYTTLGTVLTNSTTIPALKSPSSSNEQIATGEFGSIYLAPHGSVAGSPIYDYLYQTTTPIVITPPSPAGFKPTGIFHN